MYILKTKGTARIPDYFQIRDDNFILVHHFRTDQVGKWISSTLPEEDQKKYSKLFASVPYGKLTKFEF
ncbi:MAG: fructose-6-phosphate aldolase [Bacteroidia bacterium]|nr:fructose-6-phosphate aldolase [Bacteroidia bacterium]